MIRRTQPAAPALRHGGNWLLGVMFLQILTGGLVAGLDAGFIYNSFPMMNEFWLPPELWDLSPFWVNMLENIVTVQFDHRMGAYVCAILILWLWWRGRASDVSSYVRSALNLVFGAMILQICLGYRDITMGRASCTGCVAPRRGTTFVCGDCLPFNSPASWISEGTECKNQRCCT